MPYNVIQRYDDVGFWTATDDDRYGKDFATFNDAETQAIETSFGRLTAVVEMSYEALSQHDKVTGFDDAPPDTIYFQGRKYTQAE